MRRRVQVGLIASLAGSIAACEGDRVAPPAPVPGEVSATLVSPNGPEGAAVLELIGAGLGDPTAPDGRLFAHRAGDTLRVIVVLEQAATIHFDVRVPDVSRLPSARVLEVADDFDVLRSSLSGYRVHLTALASGP